MSKQVLFSEKDLSEDELKQVRKKKGKMSKRKGANGELAIAHLMKDYGFENAKRTAQHSGKNGGDADVSGVDYLHIEVKTQERMNVHSAYEQAYRDVVDKNGDDIPVVFHKQSYKSWKCTLSLNDFMEIWCELSDEQRENIINRIKSKK